MEEIYQTVISWAQEHPTIATGIALVGGIGLMQGIVYLCERLYESARGIRRVSGKQMIREMEKDLDDIAQGRRLRDTTRRE